MQPLQLWGWVLAVSFGGVQGKVRIADWDMLVCGVFGCGWCTQSCLALVISSQEQRCAAASIAVPAVAAALPVSGPAETGACRLTSSTGWRQQLRFCCVTWPVETCNVVSICCVGELVA
jgi:hypothetical protein